MTWFGPRLDPDHADLAAMLESLTSKDVVLEDDPTSIRRLVAELAAVGVWTLGTTETSGGGGADDTMTCVALERIARAWPALAWASVQVHAAIDVLAAAGKEASLVEDLHHGRRAVAVVAADAAHVDLAWDGDVLRGTVSRVDAAHERPHLLVLVGAGTALLIRPDDLDVQPVSRTGLAGALTRSVTVAADRTDVVLLDGLDTSAARARLLRGAAAAAAGIAGAAADGAGRYASERRQFGGPLTEIPMVRQTLLDQVNGATSAIAVAWAAGSESASHAAARRACDDAVDVAASALQSHGGYGYLSEYAAERHLRDAISLRAAAAIPSSSIRAAAELVGASPDTHPLETNL